MRHWKLTDILRAAIIAGLFLWALPGHAQEANFSTTVQNNVGRPVVGATVAFCNHHVSGASPCTDYATIYSDVEGAHPITNPTHTDGYGNIFIFAAPGTYDYSISGTGLVTTTYRGLTVQLVNGGPATITALTVTTINGFTIPNPLTGLVTLFSSNNLSPLFTTSVATATSTPVLSFALSNAAANTVFGNCTISLAAPSFCSITGAMLPNPSSSTLGGVQSKASVSHQWINSISTSGVPTSTQPAFSDISGLTALAQITPGSNGTCLTTAAGVAAWSGTCPNTQTQTVSGCTTGGTSGDPCTNTVTWPVAFSDATYVAVCSGGDIVQGEPVIEGVGSYLAASVVVTTVAKSNHAAQSSTVNCIGVHP